MFAQRVIFNSAQGANPRQSMFRRVANMFRGKEFRLTSSWFLTLKRFPKMLHRFFAHPFEIGRIVDKQVALGLDEFEQPRRLSI